MGNDNDKDRGLGETKPSDATEITAEVRRGRRFSLEEAVGRKAAGNLKGASPIARSRQLLMAIDERLERDLADHEGSLKRTLSDRLRDDQPFLARHLDDPDGALRTLLDQILSSPETLAELVRQTDARWGRDYDERPVFEKHGQSPDLDDPYTIAGVKATLTRLRQLLNR